ncbi:MAG: DUF3842 family protein [Treponema sp.]|nr:DUF3842 family protein [Treponema sp.]
MNILVIDGQGGGMGSQLVENIRKRFVDAEITAVGTNTVATQSMLKAGAHHAATGENAVIVGARTADIITGPVGIVIADSLYGEITPKMALAVAQSRAERILLPMNICSNFIVGIDKLPAGKLVESAMDRIAEIS